MAQATAGTLAIENTEDILDIRDIIARVEYLEGQDLGRDEDEWQERDTLTAFLGDLRGNGGDEEWRGDWYPLTLIRDSYFEEYAKELAEDIGAIAGGVQWPLHHIDWQAAAEALQMDYVPVEFDGVTYWVR